MRLIKGALVVLCALPVAEAFLPSSRCSAFTSNCNTRIYNSAYKSSRNGALSMMFDQLSSALGDIAKSLGPKQRMTENAIAPALRDVRRALLDADVNMQVADTLIDGVKRRALGSVVTAGVTADQQFIKNFYDELLDMMGGDSTRGKPGDVGQSAPVATLATGTVGNPAVVLLAGLQGAGKTTAAGKLALFLKEREVDYDAVAAMDPKVVSQTLVSRLPKTQRKVLLAAADVYRPAAIKQLEILGESINVEVFSMGSDADPVDIAMQAVAKAKAEGYDTVIVDTAGRQVIDDKLMDELRRIQQAVGPSETLLVVDAMTGQEAASLTASFDAAVGITGAILTKMDGDSRGGAAVSVRGVSGKPIKFIGTGEKTADLEPFYPDRMSSRILGMGDVVSLVEKAAAEVTDADAANMQKKMLEASFDFDDFLKQTRLVTKMGSLAGVAKMLPGMGAMLDNSKIREVEKRLKKNEAMIFSMTKKERANPDLLIKDASSRSRIIRIAKGSGLSVDDGMTFISEFQRMRTMMSRMQKQMGPGGVDPSMDGTDFGGMAMPQGNRDARRAAKKKNGKKGKGGGGGFG